MSIALLSAGFFGLPGEGETREWRLYLLLGTAFPALLVAIGALSRRYDARQVGLLDDVFGGVGAIACLVYVIASWDTAAVWLAATCTAAAVGFDRFAPQPSTSRNEPGVDIHGSYAALGLTTCAASHAFLRLGWWRDGGIGLSGLGAGGSLLVVALVVGVASVVIRDPRPGWDRRRLALCGLVAAVVFALASLRLPDFGDHVTIHHWGVFVGPADLVRDGGLLLWDVPAQYGILSTLSVAYLPGGDSWEALRLLVAAALLGAGLFVFGVILAVRPGPGGFLLGLGLALTGVFLLPGHAETLGGPFAFPSNTAFRFGAVDMVLGVALWESYLARRAEPSSFDRWAPLLLGSVVWVGAALWSVEAAAYASAAWLPAIGWSRFQLARRLHPERGAMGALLHALAAVGLPVGLLGAVAAATIAWYRTMHGLSPDFSAYTEYARSFSEGYFALPVDPWSAGLILFVIFVLVSTALARAFAEPDATDRQVVTLAAWGAVWATSSYFVSRSHPSNALNLIQVMLAAFAVLWLGWTRAGVRLDRGIRWVAVAWMASLLFEVCHEPARLGPFARALWTDPTASVRSRIPLPPASLVALLVEARVAPEDRMTFLDVNLLPTFGDVERAPLPEGLLLPSRAWLPVAPLSGALPLSEARRLEYVDRYAAREIDEGWYVLRRPRALTGQPQARWLAELVDAQYQVTRVYENAEWRLEWREPKPVVTLPGHGT